MTAQYEYVDESGGITIINKADLTANADSTYTFTNNDGTDVIIDVDAVETLTTISIDANTGIITYLDEDHQTTDLDVGALVDSTETVTTLTDLGDGTIAVYRRIRHKYNYQQGRSDSKCRQHVYLHQQ